jgi:hypothetical protein
MSHMSHLPNSFLEIRRNLFSSTVIIGGIESGKHFESSGIAIYKLMFGVKNTLES